MRAGISALLSGLWLAGVALADTPFRIGVIAEAPFAMRGEGGRWEGITVDLFAAVAAPIGLNYTLVETTPDGVVEDVAAGRLDAAIGPIVMTAARETLVDFTHSYLHSGLGVAEPTARRPRRGAIFEALAARNLAGTISTLIGLLFIVGLLIWLLERRRNPGEFEPQPAKGIFSGFWWASVTMTSVGYGDKAPITPAGRLLAIAWMFIALVLVAVFTAQLSATLTAERISSRVTRISELAHVRVGNVLGTASQEALRAIGARPIGFPDVEAGLEALSKGRIDAFVHDEPILLWNIGLVEGVAIAPLRLGSEDLAFVLPRGSELREPLNRSLLEVLASDQWTVILRLYLGISP